MMDIQSLTALADNYIWLARAGNDERWLVVDPGDATPVERWLDRNQGQLAAILLTHHHGDHVDGASELARHHHAPIYGPAGEAIAAVDHPVHGGDVLAIDGLGELQVIDCPGHTSGHIAYLWAGHLFCGDTLFAGGCGRLFEGSAKQMHHSLQRLAALPQETQICCGHEYTVKNLEFAARVEPHNTRLAERLEQARAARAQARPTVPSSLAEEQATNPFLRVTEPEVRAAAERWAGTRLETSEAVFAALRRWKDRGH
ncbi:MAG: hydroxyacylglutathione hydrolase [Halorhodospira sp.]